MLRPLLVFALNILRPVNQYRTDTVKAPKPCTLLDLKLIINFVVRMRVYPDFRKLIYNPNNGCKDLTQRR
jgi:hypothetical protein